jgi:hypothetical protein
MKASSFLSYRNGRWLWVGLICAAALIVSYVFYRRAIVPHGGTAMGLLYGIIGTLAIAILMVLGVRKRRYSSGIGTLQGWTSAHVYLGLLTLLIIPLHAGFSFGWDIHTLAFALLALVVFSGIAGVMLYRIVPARLTRFEAAMPAEKIDKEIQNVMADVRALAKHKSDRFVKIYLEEVDRMKRRRFEGWRLVLRSGQPDLLSRRVESMSRIVSSIPPHEYEDFQRLSQLLIKHSQLESSLMAQMTLRNAMEAWLYLHVPVSLAMVAAVFLHLIAVFYY